VERVGSGSLAKEDWLQEVEDQRQGGFPGIYQESEDGESRERDRGKWTDVAGSSRGSGGSSKGFGFVGGSSNDQQQQLQQLCLDGSRPVGIDSRLSSGGDGSCGSRSEMNTPVQGQRAGREAEGDRQPKPQRKQHKPHGRSGRRSLEQMREELRTCVQELSGRLDIIQEQELAIVR
jgi:hypothetical protein